MLKVENNRFYFGGISFPVPNGLYIDSCPPLIPRNGLAIYSADRGISIELFFCEYEKPTPDYMKNADYNHKKYLTMPIKKYEVNGLHGIAESSLIRKHKCLKRTSTPTKKIIRFILILLLKFQKAVTLCVMFLNYKA